MQNERDKTLDILKGITILLVVLGHAGSPVTNFFYLFHVAVFFICSGIFFKSKYYQNQENISYFIKSKITHLYIPFVLWNIFIVLIHNFLTDINIYTDNHDFINFTKNDLSACISHASNWGLIEKYSLNQIFIKIFCNLLFFGEEQFSDPSWFLRILFWISVLTLFIHVLLKKFIKNVFQFEISRFFIFFIMLIIGYICQKTKFNIYGIGIIFSCSILYYFGILYSQYKDKLNIFYLGPLSIIGLLISYHYTSGETNLVKNNYPDIFWFIFNSIAGFIFTLYISKIMYKYNCYSNFFSYLGKNSINILLFHYIGFKIVILAQIYIYFYPNFYLLASFPTLLYIRGWWLVYSITGIVVPIIIKCIWDKIHNCLKIQKIT